MFEVKAGTLILVWAPHGRAGGDQTVASADALLTDLAGWEPHTTQRTKLYDKHEVWDAVAVFNNRADVPPWAAHNIKEHGKVVLFVKGMYAMVNAADIRFVC